MQWPELWEEITANAQQALEAELRHEVSPEHPLYDVSVKAMARRQDCDDVLFAVIGSPSVAVVHLSYSEEAGALWPHTQFFGNFVEWKEKPMAGGTRA